MQNVRSEDWKETKSQGSQTGHDAIHFARFERMQDFSILKAWRKVKLHGAQTTRPDRPFSRLAWKKVKLHGAQTPDVAGTIFEGKWNCMMLKLAFEPEHALEVEETFGCYTFTYFTI